MSPETISAPPPGTGGNGQPNPGQAPFRNPRPESPAIEREIPSEPEEQETENKE